MKKLHIALSTHNIESSVTDYTVRLGCQPELVIRQQYALWRTSSINLSVRKDTSVEPGQVRHLGWEDSTAQEFSTSRDVNGILWENFSFDQQVAEIKEAWPEEN